MSDTPAPGKLLCAGSERDPLARMRAYQLAADLLDDAWNDAEILKGHRVTEKVAGQLYAAVGSIGANLAEGYRRSSGRDRAKIFEYALGSARESVNWYRAALPVIGFETVMLRNSILQEIIRLPLAAIPRERDKLIRPSRNIGPG